MKKELDKLYIETAQGSFDIYIPNEITSETFKKNILKNIKFIGSEIFALKDPNFYIEIKDEPELTIELMQTDNKFEKMKIIIKLSIKNAINYHMSTFEWLSESWYKTKEKYTKNSIQISPYLDEVSGHMIEIERYLDI